MVPRTARDQTIPISNSSSSHPNPLDFCNSFAPPQPDIHYPQLNSSLSTLSINSPNDTSAQAPSWAGLHFAPAPRKPRKDSRIINNTLRPNVNSADRILAWTSPWSIEKKLHDLQSIPLHILQQAEQIIASGLTDQTKSCYAAGLLHWHQFCDKESIPELMRMPASELLIAGFVGAHAGSVSGSTIRSWLSGLRAWHILNRAPWPSKSEYITFARCAANIKGSHHKRPVRNPITLRHLFALRSALNLNIPFHCSIWAIALTCFWGCHRLGELTIPSKSAFDPKFHVVRSSVISDFLLQSSQTRIKFHIPWTKSTKELGADVVASSQSNNLCPCKAFEQHWQMNAAVPEGSSLFSYIDESGCSQHMTKSVFLRFVSDIWSRASMQHVLGHSFRIGGAVELLLAGVAPHVVAAIGGWTSLAFLIYWRRLEDIIISQVADAYDKRWDRVRKAMEDYRRTNKILATLIDSCIRGEDIKLTDD
ncbi:hypothetical protein F5876DRAFT_74672 [Lentinula aff. lateritia]|uniref:Uncharacterized protein n=1 Tax=Lentinula aff. lateritia TaxID=2804960 RepID=A0ACC1U714_9AGAR|nr:hypothetical protein F5876DRAFT_74672 [Lentinula aff. lateritia]